MFITTVAVLAAAAGSAMAQRPANTSICDYYTTALLKNNTATNQYTLLTLVVNTAVIGNYTTPNHNAVPGILTPGTYNGTNVTLAKYFDGVLASTNNGGSPAGVNWLDGGGATPLKNNTAANGTSSNQYKLLTHLYSYFGAALGCTTYGNTSFPAYAGDNSMYDVHKYMGLEAAEVGYFIEQVGLSAKSFGVTTDDVTAVGSLLTSLFAYKCSPPTTVIPAQGAQLQAICIASDCPTATANATCSAYAAVSSPATATTTISSIIGPTATGSSSNTGATSTTTSSGKTNGAAPALGMKVAFGVPVMVALLSGAAIFASL